MRSFPRPTYKHGLSVEPHGSDYEADLVLLPAALHQDLPGHSPVPLLETHRAAHYELIEVRLTNHMIYKWLPFSMLSVLTQDEGWMTDWIGREVTRFRIALSWSTLSI